MAFVLFLFLLLLLLWLQVPPEFLDTPNENWQSQLAAYKQEVLHCQATHQLRAKRPKGDKKKKRKVVYEGAVETRGTGAWHSCPSFHKSFCSLREKNDYYAACPQVTWRAFSPYRSATKAEKQKCSFEEGCCLQVRCFSTLKQPQTSLHGCSPGE